MTTFDERENAFEAKFAHDAELQFKVEARRNKLLAHWAAEKMGLDAAATEAYAGAVIASDFKEAGDNDVLSKVLADFSDKGVPVDRQALRAKMDELLAEAKKGFIESV